MLTHNKIYSAALLAITGSALLGGGCASNAPAETATPNASVNADGGIVVKGTPASPPLSVKPKNAP